MNLEDCLRVVPGYNHHVPETRDIKVVYFYSGFSHDDAAPISFFITADDQVYTLSKTLCSKVELFCNRSFTRVWVHYNIDSSIDIIFLSRTGSLCIGWGDGNFEHPLNFKIVTTFDEAYVDVALEGHLPVMLLLTNSGETKLWLMHRWGSSWPVVDLKPWASGAKKIVSIACSGWYAAMVTSDGELFVVSLGTVSLLSPNKTWYRLINSTDEPCTKFAFSLHYLIWIGQNSNVYIEIEPFKESSSWHVLAAQDIAIFGTQLATVHENLYHVWDLENCFPFVIFHDTCESEKFSDFLLCYGNTALIQWSFDSGNSRRCSASQNHNNENAGQSPDDASDGHPADEGALATLSKENDTGVSETVDDIDRVDIVDKTHDMLAHESEQLVDVIHKIYNMLVGNAPGSSPPSSTTSESSSGLSEETNHQLQVTLRSMDYMLRNHVQGGFEFSTIWGNVTISDMQVKLQDGIVPLHRTVLFLTSTHFNELITLENGKSFYDYSEEDPLVFRAYLEYLYKQKVPKWIVDTDFLAQLNALAHRYSEAKLILDTTLTMVERTCNANTPAVPPPPYRHNSSFYQLCPIDNE